MKSRMGLFYVLLTLSFAAPAEIFKCASPGGKTVYQPEPCSKAVKQSVVEVKEMTPEETAQAKEKLKAWQERQAVAEANKVAAEQKRQEDMKTQQAQERQQMRQPPPTNTNRRYNYWPFRN